MLADQWWGSVSGCTEIILHISHLLATGLRTIPYLWNDLKCVVRDVKFLSFMPRTILFLLFSCSTECNMHFNVFLVRINCTWSINDYKAQFGCTIILPGTTSVFKVMLCKAHWWSFSMYCSIIWLLAILSRCTPRHHQRLTTISEGIKPQPLSQSRYTPARS